MLINLFSKASAADGATEMLKKVGSDNGPFAATTDGTAASLEVLGKIINAGLSLLGVVFIVLMIYAGFNWMTARGEEEKVTKAKDTIWRAIIGLIILVSSYGIWRFIENIL